MKEKFKKNFWIFINYLPCLIFVILFLVIIKLIFSTKISFDDFINLTEVIIWPMVIFASFLFFRKVFSYLFLSMEEYNFFGNRGAFKNITDVIEERVEKRMSEINSEEKYKNEYKKIEKEAELLKNQKISCEEKLKITDLWLKKSMVINKKLIDKIKEESQELEYYKSERRKRRDSAYRMRKDRIDRMEKLKDEYRYEQTKEDIDEVGD